MFWLLRKLAATFEISFKAPFAQLADSGRVNLVALQEDRLDQLSLSEIEKNTDVAIFSRCKSAAALRLMMRLKSRSIRCAFTIWMTI